MWDGFCQPSWRDGRWRDGISSSFSKHQRFGEAATTVLRSFRVSLRRSLLHEGRMKIALVHYACTPVIGGVERVMEEHARLFAGDGHEVTVLCQRGGKSSPGIRLVRLPAAAAEPAQAAVLRKALAKMDVVMVHNVMTMPFHEGLTRALR
jgi:hypothetical protein